MHTLLESFRLGLSEVRGWNETGFELVEFVQSPFFMLSFSLIDVALVDRKWNSGVVAFKVALDEFACVLHL